MLFKKYLEQNKKLLPKFVYLTLNFHNPAGTLYTQERKKEVFALLREYDLPLIEDDAYGDLYFDDNDKERCLPMKTMFDKELTICYTGAFSKILGPGFRLGWMLVPEEIYKKAELCKQSIDACSPNFTQVLANEFVKSGGIYNYINELRKVYKRRKDSMAEAIRKYFPEEIKWTEPKGGFYIWCKLPDKIDVATVLKKTISKGAVFVVGKTFDPEGKDNTHFRLSYSHTAEDKIQRGIQIIGEALKEELE